jgi:hypothetical protein
MGMGYGDALIGIELLDVPLLHLAQAVFTLLLQMQILLLRLAIDISRSSGICQSFSCTAGYEILMLNRLWLVVQLSPGYETASLLGQYHGIVIQLLAIQLVIIELQRFVLFVELFGIEDQLPAVISFQLQVVIQLLFNLDLLAYRPPFGITRLPTLN